MKAKKIVLQVLYFGQRQAIRRTKKHDITSSTDECAHNSHHSAVLVLITEIGSNDAKNERASIRRHLVTM